MKKSCAKNLKTSCLSTLVREQKGWFRPAMSFYSRWRTSKRAKDHVVNASCRGSKVGLDPKGMAHFVEFNEPLWVWIKIYMCLETLPMMEGFSKLAPSTIISTCIGVWKMMQRGFRPCITCLVLGQDILRVC